VCRFEGRNSWRELMIVGFQVDALQRKEDASWLFAQTNATSRTRDPYSGAAHGQKVHIRVDFLTNFS
jgi:hypothetical protein